MHIILKDGESVTIQRFRHAAVVDVVATRVHNASGLSVGRRKAGSPAEQRTAGVEVDDRTVVRVNIAGVLYCYKNADDAKLGEHVIIVLPNGEPLVKQVVAYGKGDYTGNIYKSAKRVDLPS